VDALQAKTLVVELMVCAAVAADGCLVSSHTSKAAADSRIQEKMNIIVDLRRYEEYE
jgi:hypothetical protein